MIEIIQQVGPQATYETGNMSRGTRSGTVLVGPGYS
jgi:hypothetical protein